MITDEELVNECCQGRKPAQRELYERFAPMMLAVCMRYLPSRDEAQDAMHDGFIKVFEKIYTLRDAKVLEDWIYHIMVNMSVDHLRKKREIVFDDLDVVPEIRMDYEPYSAEDLLASIQQLPHKYRLVFNLREVEGQSYEQIANTLGIGLSSVRSTLCRAKQMLREMLM